MTVDDTYYYFKTALNVSRGLGSSFDGINPTDGYHPLWLAILAVLFKPLSGDMVLLTRVAFTVQVVMVWAGGLLLARLREAGGARILWPLALVLANPFSAKIVLCGQETALQFLLCSAALSLWWSLRQTPHGYRPLGWAGLAVVCVLAALSRLDTVFFCAALLAMPVLVPSPAERAAGLGARLKTTIEGFVIFGCGLGAFLGYHLATFHHLMPVSGAIKAHLDAGEVAPTAARLIATVASIAGIAVVWRLARRRTAAPSVDPTAEDRPPSRELTGEAGRPHTRLRSTSAIALLAPAVAGALVVAIYNFGVRGEMSPRLIRIWYLEPYLLVGVLVVGAALAGSWRRGLVVRAFAGFSLIWLALSVVSWRYRLEPRSYNLYQAAERCSRWVEQHPQVGSVGAAWDAGFAGAFTRKPVMNLDGLISSWEYKLDYLDHGKVDDFITRRQPVDFVIQYAWPGTLHLIADRFEHAPVPPAPQPQTSVTGSHDPDDLIGRWGVDLASFYVAHVECVPVSVAYDPTSTRGAVFYFVLSRTPLPERTTLAAFARANNGRETCTGFTGPD
jgi:hypothetical protein